MLFILYFLVSSCDSIVLRRTKSTPFKIGKGLYELNLYEIDYPKGLEKKELFLNEMSNTLAEVVKSAKKVMILLREEFIVDQLHIEREGVLPEEMFLRRAATKLSKEEVAQLLEAVNYSGIASPQTLLNLQVKYILNILDRADQFIPGRNYTELQKDELLKTIFNKRRRLLEIFNQKLISLFIRLDSIYSKKEEIGFEYREHYFIKDIDTARKSLFGDFFEKFKDRATIFIDDMRTVHLERVLNSEIRINLDNYVIKNDRFTGYVTRSSNIYLIGGEQELFDFNGIRIILEVVPSNLEDLINVEEEYVMSDLFKTKKQIEKEEREFKEKVEEIKERRASLSQEK